MFVVQDLLIPILGRLARIEKAAARVNESSHLGDFSRSVDEQMINRVGALGFPVGGDLIGRVSDDGVEFHFLLSCSIPKLSLGDFLRNGFDFGS